MSLSLLNAVTSTGAGSIKSLDKPKSEFTCTVSWGGTTPTSVVVALEGTEDGTNYLSLATVTITASPTMFHIVNKLVTDIRGNYVSKVGGDATTSVTMTCTAGGE